MSMEIIYNYKPTIFFYRFILLQIENAKIGLTSSQIATLFNEKTAYETDEHSTRYALRNLRDWGYIEERTDQNSISKIWTIDEEFYLTRQFSEKDIIKFLIIEKFSPFLNYGIFDKDYFNYSEKIKKAIKFYNRPAYQGIFKKKINALQKVPGREKEIRFEYLLTKSFFTNFKAERIQQIEHAPEIHHIVDIKRFDYEKKRSEICTTNFENEKRCISSTRKIKFSHFLRPYEFPYNIRSRLCAIYFKKGLIDLVNFFEDVEKIKEDELENKHGKIVSHPKNLSGSAINYNKKNSQKFGKKLLLSKSESEALSDILADIYSPIIRLYTPKLSAYLNVLCKMNPQYVEDLNFSWKISLNMLSTFISNRIISPNDIIQDTLNKSFAHPLKPFSNSIYKVVTAENILEYQPDSENKNTDSRSVSNYILEIAVRLAAQLIVTKGFLRSSNNGWSDLSMHYSTNTVNGTVYIPDVYLHERMKMQKHHKHYIHDLHYSYGHYIDKNIDEIEIINCRSNSLEDKSSYRLSLQKSLDIDTLLGNFTTEDEIESSAILENYDLNIKEFNMHLLNIEELRIFEIIEKKFKKFSIKKFGSHSNKTSNVEYLISMLIDKFSPFKNSKIYHRLIEDETSYVTLMKNKNILTSDEIQALKLLGSIPSCQKRHDFDFIVSLIVPLYITTPSFENNLCSIETAERFLARSFVNKSEFKNFLKKISTGFVGEFKISLKRRVNNKIKIDSLNGEISDNHSGFRFHFMIDKEYQKFMDNGACYVIPVTEEEYFAYAFHLEKDFKGNQ